MDLTPYETLSAERKLLQSKGDIPPWITTPSWQLIRARYLKMGANYKDRRKVIAKTLAKHTPDPELWEKKFFDLMWSGQLVCSSPVDGNTGIPEGMTVSCSHTVPKDSVDGFFKNLHSDAMRTKHSFGVSGSLGLIRPRGSQIGNDPKNLASGVVPIIDLHTRMAGFVNQGVRRGSWKGYLPVSHGDFDELVTYAQEHDCNLGWCYSAKDIADLASGDAEAERKWNEINYLMMTRGIGDLWKTDTANEALPKWYKDLGLVTHGSNLCNEVVAAITNAAGDYPVDWDYACVLSSVNALHHKDWERDDTIFSSFVFLHCVALEAIEVGSKIPGLEATVRFLKDHMSLGLGVVGFHSALQQEGMAYGDLPSTFFNKKMFRYINAETQRASEWIFKNFRPDQCANITRDYGVANAQRMAVAPNLSSALLAGGISQGIEPIYGNVFLQDTPAGKVLRVNPKFLELMQERGYYSQATLDQCKADAGSVRSFDWLTADEKLILRTAFEIPQKDLIRMAGDRQPDIDQSQSLNLFVSADEDEAYIGELNKEILMNPYVKGRYYIRSQSGVFIDKTCTSCT